MLCYLVIRNSGCDDTKIQTIIKIINTSLDYVTFKKVASNI